MQVNFGYIQQYNAANGKGTISHTLRTPEKENSLAVFQVQQVRENLPELFVRLQKNSFRGVRVFYAYEMLGTEGSVKELWLQGSDIPASYRGQFVVELEKLWLNIDLEKPNWLDSVTKTLVGLELHRKLILARDERSQEKNQRLAEARRQEEERQRGAKRLVAKEQRQIEIVGLAPKRRLQEELKQKAAIQTQPERQKHKNDQKARIRTEKIWQFCQERSITTLIHFTRLANLHRILDKGLRSRSELASLPEDEKPIFNDQLRLDGSKDGVCMSVSFPNYKMFYLLRQYNQAGWVILLIDAAILWDLDCAFCYENAASKNVSYIPLADRKKYESLEKMFADHPLNARQQLNIPENYPTNPQAEVLVFDTIQPRYIKEVHFANITALNQWQNQHTQDDHRLFRCDGKFFEPRRDWAAWQTPAAVRPADDEWMPAVEPALDEPPFPNFPLDEPPMWE